MGGNESLRSIFLYSEESDMLTRMAGAPNTPSTIHGPATVEENIIGKTIALQWGASPILEGEAPTSAGENRPGGDFLDMRSRARNCMDPTFTTVEERPRVW